MSRISFRKQKKIILDLFFFRPTGIQIDKENYNIIITIEEDKDNNRKYNRETNYGLCNIQEKLSSLCITDTNKTLGSEGHTL